MMNAEFSLALLCRQFELDPLPRKFVLRLIECGEPCDDLVIARQNLPFFVVAGLLGKIGLDYQHWQLVLEQTAEYWLGAGEDIVDLAIKPRGYDSSVYQIIFIDERWVTWTGNSKFLDLEDGSIVTELLSPAEVTTSYNIVERTRRQIRSLNRIRAREARDANREVVGETAAEGDLD